MKKNKITFLIKSLFVALFFIPFTASAITIVAGDVDHFSLVASSEVVAGEAFMVRFTAEDKLGNPVADYNEVGSDIEIQVVGRGKLIPSAILAEEFRGGSVTKEFVYDTAETFTLVASTKLKPHLPQKVVAGKTIKALELQGAQSAAPSEPSDEELQKSKAEFSDLFKENRELEKKSSLLSTSLEKKEKEVLDLKTALSQNILERASAKGQLNKTKDLYEQAQSTLTEQQIQIRNFEEAESALTTTSITLEAKLKKTNDEKAIIKEKLDALSFSLNEKEQESFNLKKELALSLSENDALRRNLAQTKKFLSLTQAKLEQLKSLDVQGIVESGEYGEAESEYDHSLQDGSPLEKYRVKVSRSDGKYIVLPLGRNDGLEKGMMFTLYKDEEAVAEIKIAELYDDMVMAHINHSMTEEEVKEGDLVRLR